MIDFVVFLTNVMLSVIAFKYVFLLGTRTVKNPLEWFQGVGSAFYLIGVFVGLLGLVYIGDAFWHIGIAIFVIPRFLQVLAPKIHKRLFKGF